MVIRKAGQNEMQNAIELILNVFMQYEAPDYSDEGIETFKKTTVYNKACIDSLEMYGAYENGKMIGVIATRNNGNHIVFFFVEGAYHRKGIGRKLFREALGRSTAEEMTVNSSPYAVEVYHHLGFTDASAEQVTDGIRYTPMVYKKKASAAG